MVPLHNLKIGDKFLDLHTDTIFKVVSEPVDDEILCADDEGFGEMFAGIYLVRPISR